MALDYQQYASGLQGLAPVINGGINYLNAGKATDAQTAGYAAAQQTIGNYTNAATANAQPYMQAGGAAMNALGSYYGLPGYGSFDPSIIQNMPGYQFQQQQGMQAIQNSAAARGLLNSGATLQAAAQYNQGLAGTYANQYAQQLEGLGGMGLNATNNLNTNLGRAAESIGSAQIQSGNARAYGYGQQGGALQQGLYGLPQAINAVGNLFNGNGGLDQSQLDTINSTDFNNYQGVGNTGLTQDQLNAMGWTPDNFDSGYIPPQ